MKAFYKMIMVCVFMAAISCQTRIVDSNRPMQSNSVELYKKYTVLTNDGRVLKLEVLRQDNSKIIGRDKAGEMVELNKNEIREVKKTNLLASIGIALAAIAAVIFVPI